MIYKYSLAEEGKTCLMQACSVRMKSVVEKLLEHHVNVNVTDTENKAAIHYAFDPHSPFNGGYQGGDGYGGGGGGYGGDDDGENLSATDDGK